MRRRERRAAAWWSIGILVLALALAGCGAHDSRPRQAEVLGQAVEGGGQSLYAPRHRARWQATVGGFQLCVRHTGEKAVITGVRIHPAPDQKPLSAEVTDRIMSPRVVAQEDPGKHRGRFLVLGSTVGGPPHWTGSYYGPKGPAGTFSRRLTGLVVTQTCHQMKQAMAAAIDRGKVPKTTSHELLVTLTVDRRGGRVDGFDVDYRTPDGRTGVLRERWTITACGSAIQNHRDCPQGSWH